jgi:hypothetical protein
MKKRLIIMTALVFCLGAFSAAAGAKTTVQASEYYGENQTETGKYIYESTSYALDDETVYVGSTQTFSIENVKGWDWDSEEDITPKNVMWSVAGDAVSSVSQETNGMSFTVKAEAVGTATISVTYDMEYSSAIYRYTSTATITVAEKPVYEYTSYVLENQSIAKGKSRTFSIADVTENDWYSDETVTPKNVSWTVNGKDVSITSKQTNGKSLKVKAVSEGEATISVTYDMEYSDCIYRYTSTATIGVSNPKLSAKTIGINKYSTTYGSLEITGCNDYTTITCTPSSKKVEAYTYNDWWSDSIILEVEASKK